MFRRRSQPAAAPADETANEPQPETADAQARVESPQPGAASKSARTDGPLDADEVSLDELRSAPGSIDLGGLLLRPGGEDVQIQVQVDRESGQVSSVLLVHQDAAVQLVAVAAPRSRGLWREVRETMAADAKQRGGDAVEAEGDFGTELRVMLPVALPDGKAGVQPSRIVGIDGPRWLIRAQFLGRAALEAGAFDRLARALRGTVVLRGDAPMAPGEALPLVLPTNAVPEGVPADTGLGDDGVQEPEAHEPEAQGYPAQEPPADAGAADTPPRGPGA